jgi:hypothetical protein
MCPVLRVEGSMILVVENPLYFGLRVGSLSRGRGSWGLEEDRCGRLLE